MWQKRGHRAGSITGLSLKWSLPCVRGKSDVRIASACACAVALVLLAVDGYSDATHPAGRSRIAGGLLGVDEQQKTRSLMAIELASRAVSGRGLAQCVAPPPKSISSSESLGR